MRTAGAFTLHVEPATEAMPARVSIVLAALCLMHGAPFA